jgi:L-ribulokinase
MPAPTFTIGLDYGTNSVRALLVNTATGEEVATHIFNYPHGSAGIILDPKDPDLARQNPQDYLDGALAGIRNVLADGAKKGVKSEQVVGIGVDTTGSTPMPVDASGTPLAFSERFKNEPAAMAWLWKDHTSHAEAAEFTAVAERMRPNYLAKCGGRYSSEWFWSKILHCARVAPTVFDAAYTWVEFADWLPAALCGTLAPQVLKRGICAAGHKAFYNESWGGYPDEEFLAAVDPRLTRIRKTLPDKVYTIADPAGTLSAEWAATTGLKAGIPVAVGAFDVHLGAVGSGIHEGVLCKIMGTSTCDLMVAPLSQQLADIPGLCGIVPASVLPGFFGMEAGQSAVGDIFNWFVNVIQPHGPLAGSHEALTEKAAALKPGESGLLALDWNNGNRTVLVDQRLTGMILGLTLHSSPGEIYRTLIEATAFGARVIAERFQEYNVPVKRVVAGGGIASKNPIAMQIYADAMGRPVDICTSAQTCALGAAIAGAVVAGPGNGGYANFDGAIEKMATKSCRTYTPNPASVAVYNRLFALYKRLHDAFGIPNRQDSLGDVMKELLAIRDEARRA